MSRSLADTPRFVLSGPPLLVREGSAVPLNIAEQSFDRRDARAFALFAPQQGSFEASCFEDDGETAAWPLDAARRRHARRTGRERPRHRQAAAWGPISLLVRPSEPRATSAQTGRTVTDPWHDWRRIDLQTG